MIGYNAEGELVYEEAIPLKFFEDEPKTGQEWAFNIKINGLYQKNNLTSGSGYTTSMLVGVPAGTTVVSAITKVSGRDLRPGPVMGNLPPSLNSSNAKTNTIKQLTSPVDFWGKIVF